MIELVVYIPEHCIVKGTTERTEGNGRDTTFWEITEGAPLGVGQAKMLEVVHEGGEDGKDDPE
jgi:hypothetical protein